MRLSDFYRRSIEIGLSNDPRGKESVLKGLKRVEKDYLDMKSEEQEYFDNESITNPYADTRILVGTGDEELSSILVGIDIEVGEVLLADTLRQRGMPVDLVLAHHPEGAAYANLYSVMSMQSDILQRFGVPINVAESLMDGRAKEVERRLMPINNTRAVDAARLLEIPFACVHTPADNMVASFLQATFDEKQPYFLSDVIEILFTFPEYKSGAKTGVGPNILIGSKRRKAGRIFVDMTGGTEGSKDIFERLTSAGINTVVAMHLSEEHRKEAEKNHLNVIIAGHISSDNLGMNLLLDEILKDDTVKLMECSGFQRINRFGT